jgi:2,3-bisphosphoglycerate-dependent phosphoglycerate mutase
MSIDGVLLARHGETDENAARRFQGHRDPPLNDRGRAQARALGAALAGHGIRELWCSPLRRALQTAEIAGKVLDLRPRLDPRLVEVDVGAWAGRLYADLEADEPAAYAEWRSGSPAFRFPGGESLQEQGERVAEVLAEIAADADKPVLVVCHGGVIREARRVLLGAPPGMPAVENGSVHRL